MLWLYDNAICEDLRSSFAMDEFNKPVVAVVPPENILSIAAQVQEDKVRFPLVAVEREKDTPIDTSLMNFTKMHQGVTAVFDNKTNNYYYEKSMPVKLAYNLVVMSTNTADIDEILKELVFKYISQYFLDIRIPYESKRKIRFGVRLDTSRDVQWYSTASNYLQEGKLHSAGIHLLIDGAVLLTYTPVKLRSLDVKVVAEGDFSEYLNRT